MSAHTYSNTIIYMYIVILHIYIMYWWNNLVFGHLVPACQASAIWSTARQWEEVVRSPHHCRSNAYSLRCIKENRPPTGCVRRVWRGSTGSTWSTVGIGGRGGKEGELHTKDNFNYNAAVGSRHKIQSPG